MPSLAGENSVSTLNGYFKEIYGDLQRLVPEAAYLTKKVSFSEASGGLGNRFHQPVILTSEHGVTYAAANSGAFALNAAIASTMKDATVESSQILLRSRMDYESAARAGSTKKAFGDATKLLVQNMLESITKRLELMFLYGRSGIGAVNAATTASTSFVVSQATWATALWAGMEGAKIDILASTLATAKATSAVISQVDLSTRTITLTAAQTLAAGDLIFFAGAVTPGGTPTYNECLGLDKIIDVGTATDLFGINPQVYSLWKGGSYAVGGALDTTKILTALQLAIGKGLLEDTTLLINPAVFQGMINPLIDPKSTSAVRKIDNSYKAAKIEVGSGAMTIHGAHGAKVEIVPHLFVKEGDGFMLPLGKLKRIGATDVTFNTPGRGDEFFLQVPDAAGYELRCYANQALFAEQPARCVKLTGITA